MEFKLNSEESYLLIHSVFISSQKNVTNEWTNSLSKFKLTAELKYVVFDDQQGRFMDERKHQFPIHLRADIYEVQPVFQLNTFIRNETFTIGIHPDLKFYNILKLELKVDENVDSEHTLVLNIEKFKIDD